MKNMNASIAGVGLTKQAKSLDTDSIRICVEAVQLALQDAGMSMSEVDGIAARWPACLLCLPSPWSLGRVTSWTNTSSGETLKSIFKKEIHKSPKRLQRMWLALQKYNLEVHFKKGTLMHITDALSQAYLKTTSNVCKRSSVRFVHLRQLIIKSIFKLNRRNEMFSMSRLLQMVIFRNLSVLSS